MTSPLERFKKTTTVAPPAVNMPGPQGVQSNFPATSSAPSPFGKIATQPRSVTITSMIKDSDIEAFGEDVSRDVNAVTEKIAREMTVSRFGDLGDILANVQLQAKNLDPASVKGSGITGWVTSKFTDVRKALTKKLQTAEEAFDKLDEQIAKEMAVHQEWIKNLDVMYQENFKNYNNVMNIIKKGEEWENLIVGEIKAMPPIDPSDPEAAMKLQARQLAESRLNRMRVKIDNFKRLKVVIENTAPRILSQQDSSRATRSALKDTKDGVIPQIKFEFTLYLQSLDVKKSNDVVGGLRQLANSTLKQSADSAKDAAIQSATAANTATIETDTLTHIQTRLLETTKSVQDIVASSKATREADSKVIAENQRQQLIQLQNSGAI